MARKTKAPKLPKAVTPKKPSARSRKKELEKEFQKWATDFLTHRGWRHFRNNPIAAMTIGGAWARSGEKGMPDDTFVYYFGTRPKPSALTLTMWIEFKAEGEVPEPHQAKWHEEERALGALVCVYGDLDPESNRRQFEEDYYAAFGWLHGPNGRGQTDLFACLPMELIPA